MDLGCAGEAAALLVQKWFMSGPIVALMKIVILDIMKAQTTPELQSWFRETREAKFGELEEVRQSISWKYNTAPSGDHLPECHVLCGRQ